MAVTYTPTTNFGAKDSLPQNDPDKVIKGSEFTTEFTALQTAFSLAAPNASPTFTGTVTIPTADINGGAIDGTVIGAATPAAGSFTTGSFSGNVSFADNGKAIFGAGSDLQIYHTGTNSIIDDLGTGNLLIRSDGAAISLQVNSKNSVRAVADEDVELYYNGSQKLATTATGIDVTGTVTADGLTVSKAAGDIATLEGTGTTADVEANLVFNPVYDVNARIVSAREGAALTSRLSFETGTANDFATTERLRIAGNGDISFYEDTGTTPKLFWDASAESLGIGTTSPDYKLETKDGDIAVVKLESAAGGNTVNGIRFRVNNSANTAQSATLGMVNAETVDSWGGVLTFSTKPANATPGETVTERMRIDSSGNVTIGSSSLSADAALKFQADTGTFTLNHDRGAHALVLSDSDGTGEILRVDTSGNLLVGTTSTSASVAGGRIFSTGRLVTSVDNEGHYFRRNTSDGTIVEFAKDGTTVGSIGSVSGLVSYITLDPRSGGTGIGGTNTDSIVPVTGTGTFANGTKDLGLSTARWRDLYLSGHANFTTAYAATGIYLGAYASPNLLDDYEEGTWTPEFVNIGTGTYGVQVGTYTKIGNLVTVMCHLDIATVGTASGALKVSGFPFQKSGDSTHYGVSNNIHGTGWTTARTSINMLLQGGSTASLQLYYGMASTAINQITHADIGSGNFLFSMTYEAA